MKPTDCRILAIETSCDDTSAACLEGLRVVSNVVSSQADGSKFGGIVPELASRAHQANIVHVVHRALALAGWRKSDISQIAVTYAPGLLGSLFVGLNFAKGLAFAKGIPLIGVHHIEGHVLAPFLLPDPPEFPYIALIVSGGHTQLIRVNSPGDYRVLGSTLDDAAGECFDKVARTLGLSAGKESAMAGPLVDRCAEIGNPLAVNFPRPMIHSSDLNFSFSGLKTAVINHLQGRLPAEREQADLCASFQDAVVEVLVSKTLKACRQNDVNRIVVTGGVAANSRLRQVFENKARSGDLRVYIPPKEFCTDNAAMIGAAAFLTQGKVHQTGYSIVPRATMTLG